MGLLSRNKPKAEELYAAIKVNNMAEVVRLLRADCDPNKFRDDYVSAVSVTLLIAQPFYP